jgi:hypothetical protein
MAELSPTAAERAGHEHVYECVVCGDTVTNAVIEIGRLRQRETTLREALRAILTDPDALILDSHRDDGWDALAQAEAQEAG